MSNCERMQILLMRAKEDQESQHSEEPSSILMCIFFLVLVQTVERLGILR